MKIVFGPNAVVEIWSEILFWRSFHDLIIDRLQLGSRGI